MRQDIQDQALAKLRALEGVRRHPYDDATGEQVKADVGHVTIGVGINLDTGLDDYEIDMLERHRLHFVCSALERELLGRLPVVDMARLPDPVQLGLALMAFQLGVEGVMEFHEMLDALAGDNWKRAGTEALMSAWAVQTPTRARLVQQCFDAA